VCWRAVWLFERLGTCFDPRCLRYQRKHQADKKHRGDIFGEGIHGQFFLTPKFAEIATRDSSRKPMATSKTITSAMIFRWNAIGKREAGKMPGAGLYFVRARLRG
jgi:hypothetical protein